MRDFETINVSETKECLFCAETIQAAAVKCRFCGEFLNSKRARALAEGQESDSTPAEGEKKQTEEVLFRGRPSLWGATSAFIKGLVFLGLAVFIVVYPVEELSIFQQAEVESVSDLEVGVSDTSAGYGMDEAAVGADYEMAEKGNSQRGLTEKQKKVFAKYRVIAGAGLGVLVVLIVILKIVKLKMIYYEVSPERIEWSRGILDRRVDNLDMFRVIDLRLRRSLLDCILGIGTVSLITKDKTDPDFVFEKVRNCRKLYDIIKTASLEADRRNGVIHLE